MNPRLTTLLLLLMAAIGTAAPKRPNVLFLFTDDQRHDTIRALGNERIQTPHIDRLVNRGLSFTNAYIMGASSMAVCTPSRACLFSGRTLWNVESQGMWDFEIAEQDTTLTQVFLQRDYTTFATGKNDPGFGKNGHFSRSFSAGSRLYYRGGHRGQNRTPLFNLSPDGEKIKLEPDGRFNAEHFADACVEFLNRRKDTEEPFFAYVSFMTPHDPLNCPEEFLEMYEAGDMKLPANFMPRHPFDAGVHHIRDEKLMKVPRSEDKVLERLARYYALVTHTDTQIGRILDALEESGHAADTIIVFSSDNGLALGSHGLMGKQNVYEHSVKVPFLISGPGIPAGETRDQLCYIYDIFPTLCEMARVKIPDNVEYKSFKPVITDAKATHRDHLSFAFMQWHRAVRDERYKLIEYAVDGSRHTQLFDLKNDPDEIRNLAADPKHSATLSRLRQLMEKERVGHNDGTSSSGRAAQGQEFWSTYEGHRD